MIIRDLEKRSVAARIDGLPEEATALEFSPGGRLLAIGHGRSLTVRDLETGRTLIRAEGLQAPIWTAVARMEAAFKNNPDPPNAWWQPLAVAYLMVGDHAGYKRICEEMVTTWTNRPIYHATHIGPNGLSDYGPIIDSLTKMVSMPNAAQADRCSLGAILYRAGKYEQAATVLAAIVNDPDNPHTDACFYLAMSLHKLNRRQEALKALEEARRLLTKPVFTDFWITSQFRIQQQEAEALLAVKLR